MCAYVSVCMCIHAWCCTLGFSSDDSFVLGDALQSLPHQCSLACILICDFFILCFSFIHLILLELLDMNLVL